MRRKSQAPQAQSASNDDNDDINALKNQVAALQKKLDRLEGDDS